MRNAEQSRREGGMEVPFIREADQRKRKRREERKRERERKGKKKKDKVGE